MRKTFSALDISKRIICERVKEGDICIDATAGRGNDTALLCTLAGESGRVTAFDIQQSAIDSTAALLAQKGLSERAELVLGSHTQMDKYADEGTVSCITFNFGWLPGGDHSIHTEKESSIEALKKALPPSGQEGPAILSSDNYSIVTTSGWLRAGLYWLVPSLVAMTVTVPGAPPVRVLPLREAEPVPLMTS